MMLYLRVNIHVGKTFFEEGGLNSLDLEAKKKSKQFQ